jgi:tRNA A-37 threonylcarbamoyl transferase component Bud32
MAHTSLEELVSRCCELQQAGKAISLDELCADCPQLLPELRERLHRLAAMADFLGAVAPETKSEPALGPSTPFPIEPPPSEDRSMFPFLGPPQEPDELGRLGDFRIRRLLGQGGMGFVFEAKDTVLDRGVALKVMRPHIAAEPTARQRFLREARAMAAVPHERIIAVHQSGEAATAAGPVPFLVMPLLRGETLGARLKRERRPPLAEVMRIGQEMAEGLAAAHAAGLIHRDVKPENVWLETQPDEPEVSTARGRVKLLDFGLARAAEPEVMLSQPGMLVGTASYMAPEQAAGEAVDARADLFSLGCVLYEMTTGQRPFTGPNRTSILMKIASHHPTPPHQLDATVPVAWSELVMRLLAKKPEERPASAAEVVAAIRALGAGGPNLPSTVPEGQRPVGWPGRGRRWVVVAGVGLGCVLLAALLAAVLFRSPGPTPLQLQLSLQAKKMGQNRLVSLDEPNVLPLQAGDALRIEARTARPAYFYVLNMDAEGKVWPMYPWRNDNWDDVPDEKPRTFFCIPDPGQGDASKLDPGPSGIESVVVLARETPLTAAEREQLRNLLQKWPVDQGQFDPLRAAVSIGEDEFRFADGRDREVRGHLNADDTVEANDPVLRLRRLLQGEVRLLGVASRGVCYTFQGK